MKVGIIGGGSWGTALSLVLAGNEHSVVLWVRSSEKAERISADKENKEYLPEIALPESIKITSDDKSLCGCDMYVLAVSSRNLRSVCERFKGIIGSGVIVVNVAKGIEDGTLLRLSEVIEQQLPGRSIVALSGPSHAEEVARGLATTCVSSSKDMSAAGVVQDIFMNPAFRIYTNDDLTGVELGGALKNLIALAAGMSDGLGYGDNTKAALMTRGLVEITRLGVAMGAKSETFAGLTGMGDLIVTCTSMHSRNRRAGILIGQGMPLEKVLAEVHMVVEGVNTAKAAYDLSQKYDVSMPITGEIYNVLFNGRSTADAVYSLMTRGRRHEREGVLY